MKDGIARQSIGDLQARVALIESLLAIEIKKAKPIAWYGTEGGERLALQVEPINFSESIYRPIMLAQRQIDLIMEHLSVEEIYYPEKTKLEKKTK